MSLFKSEEVWIFSPMEGVITFQGEPAANAQIVRVLKWKDDEGETERFEAGSDGAFWIPGKQETLKTFLPAQFVAHQAVFVEFNGEEFQIWEMGKLDKGKFAETGQELSNLRCELTDEMQPVEVAGGLLMTSCKWE